MKKRYSLSFWLILFLSLFLAYLLVKPYFTKEFFIGHYDWFKYYVDNYFSLSLTIYITLFSLVSAFMVPITGLLTMAGGALFGTIPGCLYSTIAFCLGTSLALFMLRYFFQDIVDKKLKKYEHKIPAIRSDNWFWIVCSLYITTFTPTFVVVGLASLGSISILYYALATFIGALPGAFFYSLAGNHLIKFHNAQMPWYTYVIFILLSVLCLVPIFLGGKRGGKKN